MDDLININKEVVKDYVNLDMPTITIASTGQLADVVTVGIDKNSMVLTVRPRKTEDAEFEIIEPKRINNP